MGRAESGIDVQAVRRAANGYHLGPEFMKHLGRNVVGRAVRAIDHNFQAPKAQIIGKRAFAKFDVAPCGIVKPAGFSKRCRIGPDRRLVERSFNRGFPVVIELGAARAEKLDAVVGKRIVTRTDHHAQAGALRPREIGDARSR